MRLRFCLLATVLAASAPAQAQRLGERTTSPEAMVAQFDRSSPDEELRRLVAAADAHPLGTLENPVRVGGPEGAHAYLARLRCTDGTAPQIGPRADSGVGAFGSVVVSYPVDCSGTGSRLLFDFYHAEHVENRAPAGFSLIP